MSLAGFQSKLESEAEAKRAEQAAYRQRILRARDTALDFRSNELNHGELELLGDIGVLLPDYNHRVYLKAQKRLLESLEANRIATRVRMASTVMAGVSEVIAGAVSLCTSKRVYEGSTQSECRALGPPYNGWSEIESRTYGVSHEECMALESQHHTVKYIPEREAWTEDLDFHMRDDFLQHSRIILLSLFGALAGVEIYRRLKRRNLSGKYESFNQQLDSLSEQLGDASLDIIKLPRNEIRRLNSKYNGVSTLPKRTKKVLGKLKWLTKNTPELEVLVNPQVSV